MYIIAVSFLGYFALEIYNQVWGPVGLGMDAYYRDGAIVVRKVFPGGGGSARGPTRR